MTILKKHHYWNKKSRKWGFVLLFIVLVALVFHWYKKPREYRMSGNVMGTTWHVVYVDKKPFSWHEHQVIAKSVAHALHQVDDQMSTYKNSSELMHLNNWPVGRPFSVSSDLVTLLKTSFSISALSEGAYDVTVGSLVNLWGFGPPVNDETHDKNKTSRQEKVPSDQAIAKARKEVGYKNILIDEKKMTVTRQKDVFIDLSSIAKGYGTDQGAMALEKHGIHDYLVEVGGEVRASGTRPDGRAWRVAILSPEDMSVNPGKTVGLYDMAMATSGDYLNYHKIGEVRYSHEINPKTGKPEKNNVASVSVIAKNAMLADAYATMFMIVPPEQGKKLAREKDLAVYIIYRHDNQGNENFSSFTSPLFEKYLHIEGKMK